MNALLLSAGLGTRFRPITNIIAKPTIPFFNVPIMGYTLFELEKLGLNNLILNTHHLPNSIESCAMDLTNKQPYNVHFSFEPKILGSGGGIKKAEHFLVSNEDDDFIVSNADEIILFNHDKGLKPLLEFHKSKGALATLLTTKHADAGNKLGGVWADSDGVITQLGGTGPKPGAQHFTGIYIFSPRVFSYMPELGSFHIFKDCLHKAMAAKEPVLSYFDDELLWFDVSSEQDYLAATRDAFVVLANEQTRPSKNLVEILRRYNQYYDRTDKHKWIAKNAIYNGPLGDSTYLMMGENSFLHEQTQIKNFAVLGTESRFGPGVIESSVIAPNLHFNDLSVLRSQLMV